MRIFTVAPLSELFGVPQLVGQAAPQVDRLSVTGYPYHRNTRSGAGAKAPTAQIFDHAFTRAGKSSRSFMKAEAAVRRSPSAVQTVTEHMNPSVEIPLVSDKRKQHLKGEEK